MAHLVAVVWRPSTQSCSIIIYALMRPRCRSRSYERGSTSDIVHINKPLRRWPGSVDLVQKINFRSQKAPPTDFPVPLGALQCKRDFRLVFITTACRFLFIYDAPGVVSVWPIRTETFWNTFWWTFCYLCKYFNAILVHWGVGWRGAYPSANMRTINTHTHKIANDPNLLPYSCEVLECSSISRSTVSSWTMVGREAMVWWIRFNSLIIMQFRGSMFV